MELYDQDQEEIRQMIDEAFSEMGEGLDKMLEDNCE